MGDVTQQTGDVNSAHVPAQEIILVWVFVINLHLQLLTRNFMDNNLMYQTHIHDTHEDYAYTNANEHCGPQNIKPGEMTHGIHEKP